MSAISKTHCEDLITQYTTNGLIYKAKKYMSTTGGNSIVLSLYDHQLKSVNFFLAKPRGFDASDPGTGKTRVHLEVFSQRHAERGGAMLVIAPKSLLRAAWANDARTFTPHLNVSVVNATNREKAFKADADVYITNHDAVRWLAKQPPSFFRKFHTLVIDESTAFKHRTSQRSRALAKIRKFFAYRYALSGTLNSNTNADLWHQYFIIDDGQCLGPSFFAFRGAVCEPKQVGPMPNMIEWVDKKGIEPVIAKLVGGITMRHRLEECLSLPPNLLYSMPYQMAPAQAKAYKQMADMSVALIGSSVVSPVNAAGVLTKLLQICSGATYGSNDGDDTGGYHLVDTARYEMIGDLTEARDHSVVFFQWRHQRLEIEKELTKRGLSYTIIDGTVGDNERAKAVDLFQKGFYRVLLAHPQSAGHGLTLTKATTTIWASPTYNLEHFVQGNHRIYRSGQTQRTETIVLIAADTIEEKVYQALQGKDERMANLLDFLRGNLM